MSYINRAITESLNKKVKSGKCMLLSGARQVGKSTVIMNEFSEYNRVDFDDRLLRLEAHDEPKMFFINNPCPLIIDEVQKESAVFHEIENIVDESEESGVFIFSTSQKLEFEEMKSNSLSGQVVISELLGLSLREIFDVKFNKHFVPTEEYLQEREECMRTYDDIWKIIHRGSYPELYEEKSDWHMFYSSYVSTYLERDVNELISSDSLTFAKFMISVATKTGEILNYAKIASEVGVTEPTVKQWINILEKTGIIYLLQSYKSKDLKRSIKSPKLYFRDTGLACFLMRCNSAEELKNSEMAEKLFETFVISEIIKSYVNEGKDYKTALFHYKGRDKTLYSGNEISLIIEEGDILYPVEIDTMDIPRPSISNANVVLDKVKNKSRGKGVIISPVDKKIFMNEDLVVLPVEYI